MTEAYATGPANVGHDYASSMHPRPIDPRDTEIEVTTPTYRVFFWEPQSDHGDTPSGFRSDEYEIADAEDVHEVLKWAEANAGNDRIFMAHVVVDNTLVRLSGRDPTAGSRS